MTINRHGLSVGIERLVGQSFLTLKAIGQHTHEDHRTITSLNELTAGMTCRIRRAKLATVLLLLQTTGTVVAQDAPDARKDAAATISAEFIQELGTALKTNMAEGGPAAAIAVCRDIAPGIATDLSLRNGWKVTRVGTRVRNSMMGIADAWEQDGLDYFSAEMGAGATLANLSYSAVVTEGNKRYFRYMKPIVTQPLCLSCHGSSNMISPSTQALLDQHYPHDKAIDYVVGELRGAVSIKQPMD